MRSTFKIFVAFVLLLSLSVVGTASAQQSAARLVVNTGNLHVRSGPGAEYSIVTTVPGGTELSVLAVASDGVWYFVESPGGNGWVNGEFTVARGNFGRVPTVSAGAVANLITVPTGGQGGGGNSGGPFRYRARLNVEAANLRAAPQVNAQPLKLLFMDGTVDYEILGRTTDRRNIAWLQINVPGTGAGWIEEPKFFIALDARYRDVMTVVGETVGVVEQPGGQFLNVPPLHNGDEVFFIDICCTSTMIKIELRGGQIGWVPFYSVSMRQNTTTDLLAESGGQTGTSGQGGGGTTSPGLAVPVAIVNTGFLNIRRGPGPQFDTVATVPGGTRLSVLGMNTDGSWYLTQGDFGRGWIDTEFIIFRGNINAVPILN